MAWLLLFCAYSEALKMSMYLRPVLLLLAGNYLDWYMIPLQIKLIYTAVDLM